MGSACSLVGRNSTCDCLLPNDRNLFTVRRSIVICEDEMFSFRLEMSVSTLNWLSLILSESCLSIVSWARSVIGQMM